VRAPTDHQRRCWDALHEHGGIVPAALAVGISPGSFRLACKSYMTNAGLPGPMPHVKEYSRGPSEMERAGQELARIVAERDATIAFLRERIDDLEDQAREWAKLHRRLDAIEKAVTRHPVPVSHRRLADGGVGGKRERRAA
jgi:hypothetical protein